MPVVRKIITSPNLAHSIAPLSQAVLVNDTLYISGQLGVNREGELLEGVEAQARQSLKNHGYLLAAGGATFENVVRVTVLMSDIKDFETVNKVYREFFPNMSVLPARAAYQVAALPKIYLAKFVIPDRASFTHLTMPW